MVIETVEGTVRVRPGTAENPDAVLSGPPPVVMDVLMRPLDLATARARGVDFEGDPEALRRLTGSGEDADAEAPA